MEASSFLDIRNVGFDVAKPQSVLARLRARPVHVQRILDDISFSLNQGEAVTLYGAPAAGKTTLLRLLTGVLRPTRGTIIVNGVSLSDRFTRRSLGEGWAAGYVSIEESEPSHDTVNTILSTFGRTHGFANLPSRLGAVTEALELRSLLPRTAASLSTSEKLRVNLARAALSDAPLILLDDVAEHVGAKTLREIIAAVFSHRTIIVATRSPETAQALNVPVLLLHQGKLACSGTCNEIATRLALPRTLDVWVEGIRYDLFRTIKKHPGVAQVLLIPDGRLSAQRLRITLKSGHHLPALYDLVSRVPILRVEEIPVSLADILAKL